MSFWKAAIINQHWPWLVLHLSGRAWGHLEVPGPWLLLTGIPLVDHQALVLGQNKRLRSMRLLQFGWLLDAFAASHTRAAPWCLCAAWVCLGGKCYCFNGEIPTFHWRNIISRPLSLILFCLFSLRRHFWASSDWKKNLFYFSCLTFSLFLITYWS